MINKLNSVVARCEELEKEIANPDTIKDRDRYKKVMQEYSHLKEIADLYELYKVLLDEINDAKTLIHEETDPEMRDMAKEEQQKCYQWS